MRRYKYAPASIPSEKTILKFLPELLGHEKELRRLMKEETVNCTLKYVHDHIPRSCGLGFIWCVDKLTSHRFVGLSYIRLGDPHNNTLCYDYIAKRYFVGSWGDWVEIPKKGVVIP